MQAELHRHVSTCAFPKVHLVRPRGPLVEDTSFISYMEESSVALSKAKSYWHINTSHSFMQTMKCPLKCLRIQCGEASQGNIYRLYRSHHGTLPILSRPP